MSSRLERKRIETEYSYRPTNPNRNIGEECIRKDHEVLDTIREMLSKEYEYFRFCKECIGSTNDLFINNNIAITDGF